MVLRESLGGRKRVTGELTEVGEDTIGVIAHDGVELTIPLTIIKRANLKVF